MYETIFINREQIPDNAQLESVMKHAYSYFNKLREISSS